MIHLTFDTSGIGTDRRTSHPNYEALQRLVKYGFLKLHIPYIVKREIETQQYKKYNENYKKLISGTDKISSFTKNPSLVNDIQKLLESYKSEFEKDRELYSNEWLTGLNAKIYGIDAKQATAAFEAYFNTTAPFISEKNRQDIPDSFVCRGIEKIKETIPQLYVIANDKKVINAFKDKNGYILFNNIFDFISLSEVQEQLKESENKIIINNFIKSIREHEKFEKKIYNFLSNNIGEFLIGYSVYNIPKSNDIEGEASISSYYDIENIDIDLNKPIHYGNDEIGFRFNLKILTVVQYCIDKYVYYHLMDEGRSKKISVTPCNDYVLDAEEDAVLSISGIVSVKLNYIDLKINEKKFTKILEYDDDCYRKLFKKSVVSIVDVDLIEYVN